MALKMKKLAVGDGESVALFRWTRPGDEDGSVDHEALASFQTAYVVKVDDACRDGFCRCKTIGFDGAIVEHRFYPTDGDPLRVGDTVLVDHAGNIARARCMGGSPRNGIFQAGRGMTVMCTTPLA